MRGLRPDYKKIAAVYRDRRDEALERCDDLESELVEMKTELKGARREINHLMEEKQALSERCAHLLAENIRLLEKIKALTEVER